MAENKQPQIEWNDKDMRTTYVNATNVVAGREEVMMILGVNRAWQMNQEKVDVAISDRIVMNPYSIFAAKALAMTGEGMGAYDNEINAEFLSVVDDYLTGIGIVRTEDLASERFLENIREAGIV